MATATDLKPWSPAFHTAAVAKLLGDARYTYVPFHQLSKVQQCRVVAAYPHKTCGKWGGFADEHYFYPTKKSGKLGHARRVLAIPRAMMDDAAAMAALGYSEPVTDGYRVSPVAV